VIGSLAMLDSSVLVLNKVYRPIHVTSVRRAISLLYQGVARVLDEQFQLLDFESWAAVGAAAHDEAIHTPTRVIRVPRVIVLVTYEHMPRHRVRFSRFNVYARDDSTCQYCGRRLPRSELNLDHVVPRSRGGTTSWENVVCSCVGCNLRKGGRTPGEAGLRLLRVPARPRWSAVFRSAARRAFYRQWMPFLGLVDAAYWNAELKD
jgi:5-methylcytosine-specific restriction endonuclease McrA